MEEIKVKIKWGKEGKHFAMDIDTLQYILNQWAITQDYFEVIDLKTNKKARNWRLKGCGYKQSEMKQ